MADEEERIDLRGDGRIVLYKRSALKNRQNMYDFKKRRSSEVDRLKFKQKLCFSGT